MKVSDNQFLNTIANNPLTKNALRSLVEHWKSSNTSFRRFLASPSRMFKPDFMPQGLQDLQAFANSLPDADDNESLKPAQMRALFLIVKAREYRGSLSANNPNSTASQVFAAIQSNHSFQCYACENPGVGALLRAWESVRERSGYYRRQCKINMNTASLETLEHWLKSLDPKIKDIFLKTYFKAKAYQKQIDQLVVQVGSDLMVARLESKMHTLWKGFEQKTGYSMFPDQVDLEMVMGIATKLALIRQSQHKIDVRALVSAHQEAVFHGMEKTFFDQLGQLEGVQKCVKSVVQWAGSLSKTAPCIEKQAISVADKAVMISPVDNDLDVTVKQSSQKSWQSVRTSPVSATSTVPGTLFYSPISQDTATAKKPVLPFPMPKQQVRSAVFVAK